MSIRVWFSSQARAQARHAAEWWRANRTASPLLFNLELRNAVSLLREFPDIGRHYRHPTVPELRRLRLISTKFHLYYVHQKAGTEVEIVAIWSAKRRRRPKLFR
jgi:plasmid stabilization system protein ParE